MSIQSAIDNLRQNISDAYNSCDVMGATLPALQNSRNLADTIKTIPTGGGGAELNFAITGNPKPTSPENNTIWIDTDDTITGWTFSSTAPESPVEGMVWIRTGTSSSGRFNILKENSVLVDPWSATQYVGGTWIGKQAQIYKAGEWTYWIPYLYHRGDECVDMTGGWDCKSWKMQSDAGTTKQTFEIARNADHLMFTKTGQIGAVMYANNSIDLANVKTIHFKGEMPKTSVNGWTRFCVWTNLNGSYWATNRAAGINSNTSTPTQTFSVDVSSLNGKYYVGFGIYDANCYVKLEEMYLEVAA